MTFLKIKFALTFSVTCNKQNYIGEKKYNICLIDSPAHKKMENCFKRFSSVHAMILKCTKNNFKQL